MSEGENPTRRYKWFRPRQAVQGGANVSALTEAAVGLYNDSKGAHYLVVRGIRCSSGTSPDTVTFLWQRGSIGGTVTPAIPLIGEEANPPGQLLSADLAAFPAGPYGYTFSVPDAKTDAVWEQPFPFFIIPPNSTLYGVSGFGAVYMSINFVWEYVFPDEIDFLYY